MTTAPPSAALLAQDAEDGAARDAVGAGERHDRRAVLAADQRDLAVAALDAGAAGAGGLVVLAAGEWAVEAARRQLAAGVAVVGVVGERVDADAGKRAGRDQVQARPRRLFEGRPRYMCRDALRYMCDAAIVVVPVEGDQGEAPWLVVGVWLLMPETED